MIGRKRQAPKTAVRRAGARLLGRDGDRSGVCRSQRARPARGPGHSARGRSHTVAKAMPCPAISYGSSRACNASSVGSPANSKSPVALRSPLARGLPFRGAGAFPQVVKASSVRLGRRTSSDARRVLHAPPFGGPGGAPGHCVSLRDCLPTVVRTRAVCHYENQIAIEIFGETRRCCVAGCSHGSWRSR